MRRGLTLRLTRAGGDLARTSGALRPAMLTQRMSQAQQRLDQLWRVAQSLNPDLVLKRGYARVGTATGDVISSAAQARKAGALVLTFADGTIEAQVGGRLERTGSSAYVKPKLEQGDLF